MDEKLNYQRILIAVSLIILGMAMPALLSASDLNIMELYRASAQKNDSGLLLLAAGYLVILNTLRAVPHYAGAFVLGEELKTHSSWSDLVGLMAPFIIIPLVYIFVWLIYPLEYDFGGPAILSIVIIIAIYFFTRDISDISAKLVVIVIFLFSFQWLDLIPALSPFYFGRGELSMAIKELSLIMEADNILNFFGFLFWLILSLNAILISRLIINHFRRMEAIKAEKDKELKLKKMKIKRIADRADKEMRYLVHDLKTPLTTVQGLSEAINIRTSNQRIASDASRISQVADNLDKIISEISNENIRTRTSLKELIKLLKKQISGYKHKNIITISAEEDSSDSVDLKVNKMRFIRCLINLIDNSLDSLARKYDDVAREGKIVVDFSLDSTSFIIKVRDNGPGLEEELVHLINDNGSAFSADNQNKSEKNTSSASEIYDFYYQTSSLSDSLGLGLEFVRNVVQNHGGSLSVTSKKKVGTEFKIVLPVD